jgi:hypothetical protein
LRKRELIVGIDHVYDGVIQEGFADVAVVHVRDLLAIEGLEGTRSLRRPQITPVTEGGRDVAGAGLS